MCRRQNRSTWQYQYESEKYNYQNELLDDLYIGLNAKDQLKDFIDEFCKGDTMFHWNI